LRYDLARHKPLENSVSACRLYLITPPVIEPEAFADRLARALDAGDVACVQLRLKDLDDDAIRRAAEVLRPVVQERDVAFLMNDRPDLALETGCDGVHIGQEDTPFGAARQLLGDNATIGVTCHDSRHLAVEAADRGANYVAFGAFYRTNTKTAKGHPQPDLLDWWRDIGNIPSVAIGGITVANCATLVEAGADFLAVVSAVWDNPDGPAAAVQDFNKAIDSAASR
jgi:thiamine-phosphate pyrophosphorylase